MEEKYFQESELRMEGFVETNKRIDELIQRVLGLENKINCLETQQINTTK